LGSFFLYDILDITILPDYYFSGKTHICCFYLYEWYKKDHKKSSRKFYYSFKSLEDLYKWTITLNFLRVKSIHDDFCQKFGTLSLPMNHEVYLKKEKIKRKLNFNRNDINQKNSLTLFRTITTNTIRNSNTIKRKSTLFLTRYSSHDHIEEVKK
jgi:hypothetical protein